MLFLFDMYLVSVSTIDAYLHKRMYLHALIHLHTVQTLNYRLTHAFTHLQTQDYTLTITDYPKNILSKAQTVKDMN